jgi:hypothetical protein
MVTFPEGRMGEALAEEIIRQVQSSGELYHRLVLVVAQSGKTRAIDLAARRLGNAVTNLNLELSRRMLDLTERQRALQLPRLLEEIVTSGQRDTVFLDNTELLFDIALRQDPLRLLQSVSRNRTVVAAWNGTVANGYLTYATPGHPEYRKYPVDGLTLVVPAARHSAHT